MAEVQKEIEQFLSEVEKLEKSKQGIIEKLLDERAAIDEQLKRLGYSESKKGRPAGAKDSQKRKGKAHTASSSQS